MSDQRKTEGACHGQEKDGGKNLTKERFNNRKDKHKGYITLLMSNFLKLSF